MAALSPKNRHEGKREICQLMEFLHSSRKITVPTERHEFKLLKTVRKARRHACCGEAAQRAILQLLQLPHTRDILYEVSTYLAAKRDI